MSVINGEETELDKKLKQLDVRIKQELCRLCDCEGTKALFNNKKPCPFYENPNKYEESDISPKIGRVYRVNCHEWHEKFSQLELEVIMILEKEKIKKEKKCLIQKKP